MQTEAVTEDLATMRQIIKSNEWDRLHEKLLKYVTKLQAESRSSQWAVSDFFRLNISGRNITSGSAT